MINGPLNIIAKAKAESSSRSCLKQVLLRIFDVGEGGVNLSHKSLGVIVNYWSKVDYRVVIDTELVT